MGVLCDCLSIAICSHGKSCSFNFPLFFCLFWINISTIWSVVFHGLMAYLESICPTQWFWINICGAFFYRDLLEVILNCETRNYGYYKVPICLFFTLPESYISCHVGPLQMNKILVLNFIILVIHESRWLPVERRDI